MGCPTRRGRRKVEGGGRRKITVKAYYKKLAFIVSLTFTCVNIK